VADVLSTTEASDTCMYRFILIIRVIEEHGFIHASWNTVSICTRWWSSSPCLLGAMGSGGWMNGKGSFGC